MTENAFINRAKPPTNAALAAALGTAKPIWDKLLTAVAQDYGATIHEWKCYSPKWGWSLRVKRNARTIVWLEPSKDGFTVLFILGEAAMTAARQARLPQRVLQVINEAPKYPEGSGVRLEVKSLRDLAAVKKLALIKLTQ
jgi:hypothetical protein